jgi:hypothetical protein
MLTRTSAQDYSKSRIYMNSVVRARPRRGTDSSQDTGWINDENPFEKAGQIAQVAATTTLPNPFCFVD